MHSNILQDDQFKRKDPIVSEVFQHIKIIDQKLDSNLSAISDFQQLLVESESEIEGQHKMLGIVKVKTVFS